MAALHSPNGRTHLGERARLALPSTNEHQCTEGRAAHETVPDEGVGVGVGVGGWVGVRTGLG